MLRHTEGPWIPSDDISRSSRSGLSSCSLHDLIALNPSVVDQITSFEVGDQQTARLQTPRRARHCRRWRLWHRRNSRSNDPVRSMCSFPLLFTAPPKEPRRATEKKTPPATGTEGTASSQHTGGIPVSGMPPNLFPGKRGQLPALLAELGEQQGLREDVVLQAGQRDRLVGAVCVGLRILRAGDEHLRGWKMRCSSG